MKKIFLLIILGTGFTFVNAQVVTNPQKPQNTLQSQIYSQKPILTELRFEDLMKPISENILKNYSDYEVEKIIKHDVGGIISYSVNINKDIKKRELIFDKDGKQISNREIIIDSEEDIAKRPPVTLPDSIKSKRINK